MTGTSDEDKRPSRRPWRSGAVRLAVLGTAGTAIATTLGGCSRTGYQRNVYKNDLDCAADYTGDICRAKGQDRWDTYLGPVYRTEGGKPRPCNSNDPGAGRTSPATGPGGVPGTLRVDVVKVERGGFGTGDISSCDRRARHGYTSGSSRSSRSSWGFGG